MILNNLLKSYKICSWSAIEKILNVEIPYWAFHKYNKCMSMEVGDD